MKYLSLGRTGLMVSRTAFGAIPIQRISEEDAVHLLRTAYEGGVNFFDTAHGYSDSEAKIGKAFAGYDRSTLVLATKTPARTADLLWQHLKLSMQRLQTDYIDVYQFHNPDFVPMPGGEDGLYDAALEARRLGLIRHIGITNHDSARAIEAARSGLYETVQFPFSYLATARDLAVAETCHQLGIGFIAMKGMAGGLLTCAAAAFAYIRTFEHVVPVWGCEKEAELAEFLRYELEGVLMDDRLQQIIDNDRKELTGQFCRGCGYCLPCPASIPIPVAARMSLLLKRSRVTSWTTSDWQEKMKRIHNCTHCGVCVTKCPYGLTPYEILEREIGLYEQVLAGRS